ncbi:hypothetical protein LA080_001120 [Diaporthe eres]|uniref:Nucleotidyltransferase n=1 Tax=Diaporthe vaccinii TaxID=105482 RepID=A0ABR4F807_9PEZI|nr:hypothetical protein LA080_001120 [Diaporthe eres]
MGGNVFSPPGPDALNTPRMSPSVYNHVKDQCTSALKKLGFSRVVTPIEAPEKDSFGDVDILVCLEGASFTSNVQLDASEWDRVEKALKAERSSSQSRIGPDKKRIIGSKSFAVPWPAGLGSPGDSKAASGPRFVQVDVRVCDTHQDLEWRVFKHNHGDLWNMLGQIIRPFGLTADEVGLYLRIPEIERQDKKKARVLLTSDPTQVSNFLGLSRPKSESEKPFKTVNDIFEYAASCKWFTLWPRDQEFGEEKASDRSRMKQRPLFKRWVDEFIPACRAKGRFKATNPQQRTPRDVRDEVRKEAFRTFPGSEAAYNTALADWNKEKTRLFVKNKLVKEDACLPEDITPFLPKPREHDDGTVATLHDLERNWRGVLRSALAKVIIDDDDRFGSIRPPGLRDAEGVLDVDRVKEWIDQNWKEVGRVAWELNCERSRESMERKRKAAEGAQGPKTAAGAATGGKR